MDGIRESDGQSVTFKLLNTGTILEYGTSFLEGDLLRELHAGELGRDPLNHCVPLYEVLHVPGDPNSRLLVTPMLRAMNDPPFDTVGEIVDCIRQIFEVRAEHAT